MVDTCHVTGVVISPDGDPVPRATVRFQRLPHEVFVEEDRTGIPREVRAEADQDGAIAVDLIPGEYKTLIIARGYNQYPAFNVGVPDAASAVLADIQDVPPPPSLDDATRAVRDARDARDEAREARDEAATSAQAAADAAQGVEDHASAAANSAQAAADSEQAAATSAGNAATSEGNAAASATAAGNSASAAATSEQNAATSAQAAAGSASAASASASDADGAKQAAEAAAQTATEVAGALPDPEGAASGQLVETDGADGFRLIDPGDMRALRRRDAWMGFVRSRVTIWDDGDAGVSAPTNAIGLQLPSGQTWQGFQSVSGNNPILEYLPEGWLRVHDTDSSAVAYDTAAVVAVPCGSAHRKIRVQAKAIGNQNRRFGLVLSYFDNENFLIIEMAGRVHDLTYVLDGQATNLGSIGPAHGLVLSRNTLDITATVARGHDTQAWVEFASHGLGVSRIELPQEAYVFCDLQNPGMVGFCSGDAVEVYGFAVMELD